MQPNWKEAEEHLSRCDPVLGALIEALGPCSLKPIGPPFDVLCRAIIGQQISLRAAQSLYRKLLFLIGGSALEPESILRSPESMLRQAGLSRNKIQTLRCAAQAVCSGRLSLEALASAPMETVFHHLTALPGVGRWTAEMVLIFAYLHPRILPVQDLGLKRAVQIQYGPAERPSEKMLHALARPWAPYETIATWYLWKSVDGDPSL